MDKTLEQIVREKIAQKVAFAEGIRKLWEESNDYFLRYLIERSGRSLERTDDVLNLGIDRLASDINASMARSKEHGEYPILLGNLTEFNKFGLAGLDFEEGLFDEVDTFGFSNLERFRVLWDFFYDTSFIISHSISHTGTWGVYQAWQSKECEDPDYVEDALRKLLVGHDSDGPIMLSVDLTETSMGGTNVRFMDSTFELCEDGKYRLSVSKNWITNNTFSRYHLIFATNKKDGKEIYAFLVPAEVLREDGNTLETDVLKKRTITRTPSGSVSINATIDKKYLLSKEGYRLAMKSLGLSGRNDIAMMAAQNAMIYTLEALMYAAERETDREGHVVLDTYDGRSYFAKMLPRSFAGIGLSLFAAFVRDTLGSEEEKIVATALAKYYASECKRATSIGNELVGAYALDLGTQFAHRDQDQEVCVIGEGAPVVQRLNTLRNDLVRYRTGTLNSNQRLLMLIEELFNANVAGKKGVSEYDLLYKMLSDAFRDVWDCLRKLHKTQMEERDPKKGFERVQPFMGLYTNMAMHLSATAVNYLRALVHLSQGRTDLADFALASALISSDEMVSSIRRGYPSIMSSDSYRTRDWTSKFPFKKVQDIIIDRLAPPN